MYAYQENRVRKNMSLFVNVAILSFYYVSESYQNLHHNVFQYLCRKSHMSAILNEKMKGVALLCIENQPVEDRTFCHIFSTIKIEISNSYGIPKNVIRPENATTMPSQYYQQFTDDHLLFPAYLKAIYNVSYISKPHHLSSRQYHTTLGEIFSD